MMIMVSVDDNNLIEISFRGPINKLDYAIQDMLKLGFVTVDLSSLPPDESVPWREAFPEMSKGEECGIVLKETRKLVGLTQKQLSALTGIPQRHLSEMETAKRPIGKENAKRLAKVLDVNYRIFL